MLRARAGKKAASGGIKGVGGVMVAKGDRRLSNRSEREREGKVRSRAICPLLVISRRLSERLACDRPQGYAEVTWMVEPRKCQDIIFCFMMLAYWVGMVWVSSPAIRLCLWFLGQSSSGMHLHITPCIWVCSERLRL